MKTYTVEEIEEKLHEYVETLECPEVDDVSGAGVDPDELQGCVKCAKMLIRELPKLFMALVLCLVPHQAHSATETAAPARPGEFIVKYRNEPKASKAVTVLSKRLKLALLKGDVNAMRTAAMDMAIEYAEPNYIYTVFKEPNDTGYKNLWAMPKIAAPVAWDIATGDSKVVVGIIDTGVDYEHVDLKENTKGKGFNAITGKLDGMDDQGHGTHVAGTIGAIGDNSIGVVGVNWSVSLFGSKFLNSDGSGTAADAIKAIDWAVENGAKVLNNSWGGGGASRAIEDSISAACEKGVIFVAAAGNGGMDGVGDNNDVAPSYPASYKLPCVISVAATDQSDKLTSFSNYGNSVHVAAPGYQILSTFPDGKYATASGTSMAAPHVTGLVALMLSLDATLTAVDVKKVLQETSDTVSISFFDKYIKRKKLGGGRINARRALEALK